MCHILIQIIIRITKTLKSYGVHRWELPAVKIKMELLYSYRVIHENIISGSNSGMLVGYRQQDEPYRWFARL